jgi:DnaK suppressor protein
MTKNVCSDVELASLRTSLLSERSRLSSEGQHRLEVLLTSENAALDDQAALLHEQFVALTHRRQESERLALIDAALRRIERGEFGLCQSCEEVIPTQRLRVVPWALFCIPCQQKLEAKSARDSWLDHIGGGGLCSDA